MNHYVVLTKVRKSSYVVHDPALGKRIIGLQEMSNIISPAWLWNFGPIRTFSKKRQSTLRLLDLMRNIVGLKSALIKIFAFSVIIEAIGLYSHWYQLVTDHVIMAHDQSLVIVIV